MQSDFIRAALPFVVGVVLALGALLYGLIRARFILARAREECERLVIDAEQDTHNKKTEILVSAQEKALAYEDECDRRERDLEVRESRVAQHAAKTDREASELGRRRKQAADKQAEADGLLQQAADAKSRAEATLADAQARLEGAAGLTAGEARAQLLAQIEADARDEGTRLARKIEESARENAEHEALNLMLQATQRVNIRDITESTVSFIELPSDEMKGRIIGKEGRNIRALEMTTGIDLVVDDTPRSILISSFDPVRREIARVAIARLVEDGRIHPARIEEVVQRVRDEIDELIDERGNEAVLSLGISDMHTRLTRLVGRMRYHTHHGQNLLQHCLETSMIAGYMADQVGARVEVAHRAGLLHEISLVADPVSDHPLVASAELGAAFNESEDVVHAIRSLHPDVRAKSVEALLVSTANRLSETRPGARKENLAVFIERLKRLESIATSFSGVERAYAVKAGKEIRVIVDTSRANDKGAYGLSREIARAVERQLNYPGQIKVSVVRETRAVRYAL